MNRSPTRPTHGSGRGTRAGISDTSAKAEAIAIAIYRDMPAWRKVQLVEDANYTARQLGLAGIRARHGNEPLSVSRRRLLGLMLGEQMASVIYGPIDSEGP